MPDDASAHDAGHGETTWERAEAPLCLAIDIGSSSVRALTFDRAGLQIRLSEHQVPYRLQSAADGTSQADPDVVFDLVCECIDAAVELAAARANDIGAVATSSFWHSLVGLDAEGRPSTPVLMWADKRSGGHIDTLGNLLDPKSTHQRTGCRFHSSYWPAKLLWLRDTDAHAVSRTGQWCSFPDLVDLRLRRSRTTSISMASGTGMLETATCDWYPPLLEALDLDISTLPELVDRDLPLPPLGTAWRSRWPHLADVPWFPAIGDGAAANLGTGAVGHDRIAITIGTSGAMRVVTEDADATDRRLSDPLWSYRLDRTHRVTGGALSNGGNVTGWLARHLAGGDFDRITDEASRVAPDGHGLTVLPLLAGERAPSWNDDASGVFAGLTMSTRPGHLYRATLEATAYRFAAIHEALEPFVTPDHRIYVNGAAALKSPLWLAIIADTLGTDVAALDADAEASARGAAIAALHAIGAIDSLRPETPAVRRRFEHHPDHQASYRKGRARQSRLEAAMLGFWHDARNET